MKKSLLLLLIVLLFACEPGTYQDGVRIRIEISTRYPNQFEVTKTVWADGDIISKNWNKAVPLKKVKIVVDAYRLEGERELQMYYSAKKLINP